jgi:hypothetical protein
MVGDVQDAAADLTERVAVTLNALEPLTHVRVAVVHRLTPLGSDGLCDVDLDLAQGFAELFPTRRLRAQDPFEVGSVIAFGDAGLDQAIDLTPYGRWERCSECHRHELFYLSKRKKTRADH